MEAFQTIGAAAGAIAAIGGLSWAVAEFFLFARLARRFTFDITSTQFADSSRGMVFAEVQITNVSKTRTTVEKIEYRPLMPSDWSPEARQLASLITDWQPIATSRSIWNPSEHHQGVLVIPWADSTQAVPVQFQITHFRAIDRYGIRPMILWLFGSRSSAGKPITSSTYRIVTQPGLQAKEAS